MWRLIPLTAFIFGCTPVKPEYRLEGIYVKWPVMTDRELLKKCGNSAKGCAEVNNELTECTIYGKDPKYVNDNATKTIGHETVFCFTGRYHGE